MRKQMKIFPNEIATQRTKNRLRENGPIFFIVEDNKRVKIQERFCSAVLIQSQNKEYSGWFPKEEIIMEEI